jgi:hypothetical protein
MSAIQTPTRSPHPPNQILAHQIRIDCDRALRRLDRLDRERHDVLLDHARQLIRHAAALSREIEPA